MRLARAVRVRVVDAVSPADCLPLAVGALRARWKVLGRVDIKLVAAVGALVGAGRRVAAGGYWVSHVAPPLALRTTPGWAWTNVARPVRWNAVVCSWELSRLLNSMRGRQAARKQLELAEASVPLVCERAGLKGWWRLRMCQQARLQRPGGASAARALHHAPGVQRQGVEGARRTRVRGALPALQETHQVSAAWRPQLRL